MKEKLKEIGMSSKEVSYCKETKTISLGTKDRGRVLKIRLDANGLFCFSLNDSKEVERLLEVFSVEEQNRIKKALLLNRDSCFYCK